jgi:agmatine deiminase
VRAVFLFARATSAAARNIFLSPATRSETIPMTNQITIAGIQMSMSARAADNVRKAERLVRAAARRGARIICLPELYRTLYFPQAAHGDKAALAETIPGESSRVFAPLAKELGVVVIVPIYEQARGGAGKSAKGTPRYYNSAIVFDERGRLLRTYRKIHIPHDPLFYEKNFFEPGDAGYLVYKTKHATFAVLICYDQWFPEAARQATLAGAEIIFYPTAIGHVVGYRSADGDWEDAWETIMRGHAIANGTHIVAVNRAGREAKLRFWGHSFACDSFGKVLQRLGNGRDEILLAQLNLAHNRRIREGWGFLRNRRPETYRR